jgi:hypothetical protein
LASANCLITMQTNKSSQKLACVITTYNRVSDAKAQMDIIKELWQPKFSQKIDIYHEFNGKEEWYPEKYREDYLRRHPSKPHFHGAIDLINQGVSHVLESKHKYDFIVVASSDAWVYDPEKIHQLIKDCHEKEYQLATSIWFGIGLATEFFIITPELAEKIFPIDYEQILENHKVAKTLDSYSHTKFVEKYIPWSKMGTVEFYFTIKAREALKGFKKIYFIPGRKFIFFHNRFSSKNFYSSHHDVLKRKQLTKLKSLLREGNFEAKALKEII